MALGILSYEPHIFNILSTYVRGTRGFRVSGLGFKGSGPGVLAFRVWIFCV